MNSINFEYYKAFYYVVKFGTITRAAEELFVTQPSLTKEIKNLEDQLGCVLFTRTAKGVTLTTEGSVLYDRIAAACESILQAEEELNRLKNLESGIVRINSTMLMIRGVLVPVITAFRNKYKNVQIELYMNSMEETQKNIVSGSFDLALDFEDVLYQNPKRAKDNTQLLKVWTGKTYRDIPCAGLKFSKYRGRKLTQKEIADFPLIFRPVMVGDDVDFYRNTFRESGELRQNDIVAYGIETRIALVQSNLGISFMPAECCESYIESGNIIVLDYDGFLPERRLAAFTNSKRTLSLAAKGFLDLLLKMENMTESRS